MPRPLRINVPGGLYHVTGHSNHGRPLFREDIEREQFLVFVSVVVADRGWSCRAYCLLTTHYHLLVETPEADLAAGMQRLNGRYAQWANWLRGEVGHVFRARYHAILVDGEGHRLEVQRYIALNPVRAQLVPQPELWPWGSYPALLELAAPPAFLDVRSALVDFGATPKEARASLQAFVDDPAEGA